MSEKPDVSEILELTTEIVAAHVGNNTVAPGDLPQLIQDVYKTLTDVGANGDAGERPRPAVPAKKSVFPDYIVCLEDGKKLKMLKRHLKTAYNMSPEAYRDCRRIIRWSHRITPSTGVRLPKKSVWGRSPAAAAVKPVKIIVPKQYMFRYTHEPMLVI
jgi:predicted transcriptional regulator